ncbi:hypothetical protein FQA39_LY05435 [Lamprigera yunnana]|nr:hypothetical protein FQA39_LY05435 [Lamprigera yunnana]
MNDKPEPHDIDEARCPSGSSKRVRFGDAHFAWYEEEDDAASIVSSEASNDDKEYVLSEIDNNTSQESLECCSDNKEGKLIFGKSQNYEECKRRWLYLREKYLKEKKWQIEWQSSSKAMGFVEFFEMVGHAHYEKKVSKG